MLLKIASNPLKTHQYYFLRHLELLLSDIDKSICNSLPITLMGDWKLDFSTTLERENLEMVSLTCGFSVPGHTLPTRIYKTTKMHID